VRKKKKEPKPVEGLSFEERAEERAREWAGRGLQFLSNHSFMTK